VLGNTNSSRSLTSRRSRAGDGELDITPMIDVTFLLLIFFMVTSTMKATPDKDIPAAQSGTRANVNDMMKLTILNSASSPEGGTIMLEDRLMTRDELQARLTDEARGGAVRIMIYAERDVKSGFVGDVEDAVKAVDGDVGYQFAVQDFR
jgi:biopolymer transport protein ExbD